MDLSFWFGYLACALVFGACQMLSVVAERNVRIAAARRRAQKAL